MSILDRIKPVFWDYKAKEIGPFKRLFNFQRLWRTSALLMSIVAIVPLLALAYFDCVATKKDAEIEISLRTARVVSNTKRTVSFFLEERKAALDFLVLTNSFNEINDKKQLTRILGSLRQSIGGFTDLGVIDAKGIQVKYVGPFDLEGKDYSEEEWFVETMASGVHISEVFLGFREIPHLVIAVRQALDDGGYYVLRTTIDTDRFNQLLSGLSLSGNGDSFLINRDGAVQTPSLYHGNVLDVLPGVVPDYSEHTEVREQVDSDGRHVILGYAYIPESPFILMVISQKDELMDPWYQTRRVIYGLVAFSVVLILFVAHGVSLWLVNDIFIADQRRIHALREVEHTSKLASIGRLSAGVAHEINNPLAIINEKAGLIKDLFTFQKRYEADEKLLGLIDSIIFSVERCGAITKRLLAFARHLDVKIQSIHLAAVIEDVLGFLKKEAEYRSIAVTVDIPEDIPDFETDRGKVQQIFLNLVNNAFQAMKDGGHLDISANLDGMGYVSVTVVDDGSGIPAPDLKRIFEPFFSTKTKTGGTGLGLSITYGLVQELGGKIQVESELGKGTKFIISLPLKSQQQERGGV